MAEHAQRRSKIIAEIAQLHRQQNDAIEDAVFLGNHSLSGLTDTYAKRARRIADLLSELALLNEKHSVHAD